MRIINVYDKDEPRAGDRYSGPAQYFDFPVSVEEMSIRNRDQIPWDDDILVILGGGGLMHIPFPEYNDGRFVEMEEFAEHGDKVITWGLGHNVHGSETIEYPDYMDKFLLNGVRDHGFYKMGLEYVPCVSCMHEAFSKDYPIKEKVRMFRRDDPNGTDPLPFNYPVMQDAQGQSLDEIVEWLAGAEVIITNSYHGMYWSMLLGKTVRVYKPMSSKFFRLAWSALWENDRSGFRVEPKSFFIDICRSRNKLFYKEVLNLLKGRGDR